MTIIITAPMLTYGETAKLLHVSDRTVWQMVKDGRLPAVRFGGSVRIDPADVDRFVQKAKEGQGEDHVNVY